jgi:hypothetical protein
LHRGTHPSVRYRQNIIPQMQSWNPLLRILLFPFLASGPSQRKICQFSSGFAWRLRKRDFWSGGSRRPPPNISSGAVPRPNEEASSGRPGVIEQVMILLLHLPARFAGQDCPRFQNQIGTFKWERLSFAATNASEVQIRTVNSQPQLQLQICASTPLGQDYRAKSGR